MNDHMQTVATLRRHAIAEVIGDWILEAMGEKQARVVTKLTALGIGLGEIQVERAEECWDVCVDGVSFTCDGEQLQISVRTGPRGDGEYFPVNSIRDIGVALLREHVNFHDCGESPDVAVVA